MICFGKWNVCRSDSVLVLNRALRGITSFHQSFSIIVQSRLLVVLNPWALMLFSIIINE